MSELKELKGIIETELGKTSYNNAGNVIVEESAVPYSASVNLENNEMRFGFNLNHPENHYVRRKVARDLPRHEFLHLGGELAVDVDLKNRRRIYEQVRGIPGDVRTSETSFFNPIYDALSKKGFSMEDAHYVENTLEDTLLHLEGARRYGKLDRDRWNGVVRFFGLQDFSDYYEAHVALNMLLWGTPNQKDAIRSSYKGSEKANKALANFFRRTGAFSKGKDSDEWIQGYFLNSQNWTDISRIYAEEFSALMSPNYARPTVNHNGAGTKGRESENASEQGNVFQRQRNGEQYKRGRARESFEQKINFPVWMRESKEDKIKSLNLLYDSLVSSLEIRAEAETVSDSLPIANLVTREFDPLTDSSDDVTVGINDFGKPALYVPRKRLELPFQLRVGNTGFPKIKYVVIDSSESMKTGIDEKGIGNTVPIAWGDNSKYHFEVLAWKGFTKYLILNGLLYDKDSIELDNFSTKTLTGKGLDAANRAAMSPQWKNTYLDKNRVKEIFRGSGNLVLTTSDGEIANWGEVRDIFIPGAKRNQHVHLQIGGDSPASLDMRANNLNVEPCRGHMDLVDRVIDLVRRIKKDGI